MAKGGELWDDSALVVAFDHAMSTYKKMHKKKGQDTGPDMGPDNSDVITVLDNIGTEINDENAAPLSMQRVNGLTAVEEYNDLPLITEDPTPETSADGAIQGTTFDHHSAELDGYNQLVGQYYELEASRQKVLEQLNQYGYLNYQNYGASQVNPGPGIRGASSFPHDHVSACQVTCPTDICCCCHYVSTASAVPCTLSACSVGGTTGTQHYENAAIGNREITRTAMEAVGKALSSLKAKPSTSEDKEAEVAGDKSSSTSTETDITDVLNAWYTAGFYTGKYLAERSAREKPRG